LHDLYTSFVLGYHGCDRSVAEILLKNQSFRPSTNPYDCLGAGVYFWETNPARALHWAKVLRELQGNHGERILRPYVVGAVISLGYCLDLTSATGIEFVRTSYDEFRLFVQKSGGKMPRNVGGKDLLRRYLDCAVINHIHEINKLRGLRPFDTVRAVFVEGQPVYPGSGFREHTHVQVCVRNFDNIKGVFRVPSKQLR
jgi:hypothetical protein